MQSRISHTFEMNVTCAMWHEKYGPYGGSSFVVNDGDLNEIVIQGVDREDLIQMFRNAFCASDAPSEKVVESFPEYTKKMMHDIATKFLSYECISKRKAK